MENTEIMEYEIETIEADVSVLDEVEEIEDLINQYESYQADYSEVLVGIQESTTYIPAIASDVRVLLVVAVLTFCWSCMRSWRVHVMGGRK